MPPNYCILKNNTYLCTRNRERLILIKNDQSGQMGLTVTQLAFAFGGSNPSLPTKKRLERKSFRSFLFLYSFHSLITFIPSFT